MKAANQANFDDLIPADASHPLAALQREIEESQVDPVEQEMLNGISIIQLEIAAADLDPDRGLQRIAEHTLSLMAASGVAIGLLSSNDVVCRARAGAAPEIGTRLDRDHGLSGECLRTGKIIHCPDTAADPRVDAEACRQLNLKSAAVLPICSGGHIIGVLDVFSAEAFAFGDAAVLAASKIAQMVAFIAATSVDNSGQIAEPPHPKAAIAIVPKKTPKGAFRAGKYVVAGLALLMAVGYVLASYRPRGTPSPSHPPKIEVPEKSAPPEAPPAATLPTPAEPASDIELPGDTGKAPPEVIKSVVPGPSRRGPVEQEPPVVVRHLSIAAGLRKVRQPETPPPPSAIVKPNPLQDNGLGGLIQAPVSHPKLAMAEPVPTQPANPNAQQQVQSKRGPLARVLGRAKKPVRALRKKDSSKDTGEGKEASPANNEP